MTFGQFIFNKKVSVRGEGLSFEFWKFLGSKILKSEEKKCLQRSLDRC
jgi:hypothetical protein